MADVGYNKSAAIYEVLYSSFFDFSGEADYLRHKIAELKRSDGNDLLDVACGPGTLDGLLQPDFRIVGVDLSPQMIDFARQHQPNVEYRIGDMADFDLAWQFDVVICMGSAIGVMLTTPRLQQAIANMARHLRPGGVLAVTPWLTADKLIPGYIGFRTMQRDDLKIAMMSVLELHDGITSFDMHHLVGTPQGVEHIVEHHDLALFSYAEYCAAFVAAGLTTGYDPDAPGGRGMYFGVKEG